MQARKLVRIKQKGQLTLPATILRELGLKEGDMVDIKRTEAGQIVITPQELVAMAALDELGTILKETGFTLEELIESGREIRGQLIQEQYGLSADDKQS